MAIDCPRPATIAALDSLTLGVTPRTITNTAPPATIIVRQNPPAIPDGATLPSRAQAEIANEKAEPESDAEGVGKCRAIVGRREFSELLAI
jgi:hypothetical protein